MRVPAMQPACTPSQSAPLQAPPPRAFLCLAPWGAPHKSELTLLSPLPRLALRCLQISATGRSAKCPLHYCAECGASGVGVPMVQVRGGTTASTWMEGCGNLVRRQPLAVALLQGLMCLHACSASASLPLKCLRCTRGWHARCRPAGARLVSRKYVVCPRHGGGQAEEAAEPVGGEQEQQAAAQLDAAAAPAAKQDAQQEVDVPRAVAPGQSGVAVQQSGAAAQQQRQQRRPDQRDESVGGELLPGSPREQREPRRMHRQHHTAAQPAPQLLQQQQQPSAGTPPARACCGCAAAEPPRSLSCRSSQTELLHTQSSFGSRTLAATAQQLQQQQREGPAAPAAAPLQQLVQSPEALHSPHAALDRGTLPLQHQQPAGPYIQHLADLDAPELQAAAAEPPAAPLAGSLSLQPSWQASLAGRAELDYGEL